MNERDDTTVEKPLSTRLRSKEIALAMLIEDGVRPTHKAIREQLIREPAYNNPSPNDILKGIDESYAELWHWIADRKARPETPQAVYEAANALFDVARSEALALADQQFKDAYAALEQQKSAWEDDLQALRTELEKAGERGDELEAQLKTTRDELNATRIEGETARSYNATYSKTITELRNALATRDAELSGEREARAGAEQRVSDYEARLKAAQAEHQRLRDEENLRVQTDTARYEAEREQAQAELNAARETAARQLAEAQQRESNLQTTLESHIKALAETQGEVKRLVDKNVRLNKDLEAQSEKQAKLERQQEIWSDTEASLTAKIIEITSQLSATAAREADLLRQQVGGSKH